MKTREQILIERAKPQLPIVVFPERGILPKLRETLGDDSFDTKTEFEVYSMVDMLQEGGICCEVKPVGVDTKDMKAAFVCSITHFKIKKGQPMYSELEKYRVKRIRMISRGNRRR